MKISVLQHEHDLGDDRTNVKLIGVYGTEADALAARDRLSTAPGFKDHPDGFCVDAYDLGRDHWTHGFMEADADGNEAGARTAA